LQQMAWTATDIARGGSGIKRRAFSPAGASSGIFRQD
jgi:hypothetical protein